MKANWPLLILVLSLMLCNAALADIAYEWTFDGTNGKTASLPEPIHSNLGTAIGGGSISTTGSAVGSGAFARPAPNGNNDRISMSSGGINVYPGEQFTITAWIKTTQASYPSILSWCDGPTFASEFRLNGGVLQASQYYRDVYNQSVMGQTLVKDGTWHFVALTRQLGGATSLFVDSGFDVEDSLALNAGAAHYVGRPVYLGGHDFHPAYDYSLDGMIDDVAFWAGNRLDARGLRAIHNLGTALLDYNAWDASVLFNIYNGAPATMWKGFMWRATAAGTFHGSPGDVVSVPNNNWGLVLNSDGSGVATSTLIPGDFDLNGEVNAADYVAWRNDPALYGGNPGGFNTWRANFGCTVGGSLSGVPVFEPTSCCILVLATVGFLSRRLTTLQLTVAQ